MDNISETTGEGRVSESEIGIAKECLSRINWHLSLAEGASLSTYSKSFKDKVGKDYDLGLGISAEGIDIYYMDMESFEDVEFIIQRRIAEELTQKEPKYFSDSSLKSSKKKASIKINLGTIIVNFPKVDEEETMRLLNSVFCAIGSELSLQSSGEEIARDLLESIRSNFVDSKEGERERRSAELAGRLWKKVSEKTEDDLEKLDPRVKKYSAQTGTNGKKFMLEGLKDYFKRKSESDPDSSFEKVFKSAEKSLNEIADDILSKDEGGNWQRLRLAKNIYIGFSKEYIESVSNEALDESPVVIFCLGNELDEQLGTGYDWSIVFKKEDSTVCLVIDPKVLYRTYFLLGDINSPDGHYQVRDPERKKEADKMDFRGAVLLKISRIFTEREFPFPPPHHYDEGRVLPEKVGNLPFSLGEVESIVTKGGDEAIAILENLYPHYKGKFRNPRVW